VTLTDEQLVEALKARGHHDAATAVAADAGIEPGPERTPEQGLHHTIRNTLTNPPKQGQHQAVADLFTGEHKNTNQDDSEEQE
jgi:hypothetical protein